jgi:hypothetical protein
VGTITTKGRLLAYLTIARICGDPDRLLDGYRRSSEVMDGVGHDHGLILHATAKTDEGLVIVNLWPSRDGAEAAAADPRRLAALEQEAVTLEQLRKEHHDVERCVVSP